MFFRPQILEFSIQLIGWHDGWYTVMDWLNEMWKNNGFFFSRCSFMQAGMWSVNLAVMNLLCWGHFSADLPKNITPVLGCSEIADPYFISVSHLHLTCSLICGLTFFLNYMRDYKMFFKIMRLTLSYMSVQSLCRGVLRAFSLFFVQLLIHLIEH